MPPRMSLRFDSAARRLASLMVSAVVLVLSPAGAPAARAADAGVPDSFDPGLVWCAVFSPDGRTIAAVSGQQKLPGQIMLWDVPSGRLRFLRSEKLGVRSVAFSRDGKVIAVALYAGTVNLLDARTGKERAVLKGHTDGVNGIAFLPGGKTLASASLDGTVKLWDLTNGKERQTLRGHPNCVLSVDVSPDGKTLATSGGDPFHSFKAGEAILWDLAKGKERASLTGHHNPVECIAYAPDGKTVATASWDRTVKLWDPDTGKERKTLEGHLTGVFAIRFSPDGKLLAAAAANLPNGPGEITLWDVAKGRRVASRRQAGGVTSVHFSPDGKTLVTAAWDSTVRLWELATMQERKVFHGYQAGAAPHVRQNSATPPTNAELEKLCTDLEGADAVRAYRAVWALVDSGEQGMRFLRAYLRRSKVENPTAAPDGKRLARLIVDLDDDKPDVREAAFTELAKLGKAAESALRRTLRGRCSPEVRQRVQVLLGKLAPSGPPSRTLLRLRSIEVLEQVGSAEARRTLSWLAEAPVEGRVKQEAKASLDRLAKRPIGKP